MVHVAGRIVPAATVIRVGGRVQRRADRDPPRSTWDWPLCLAFIAWLVLR